MVLVSGGLLFVSKATSYMVDPYFLTKDALMVAAGINMLAFHIYFSRGIDQGGASPVERSRSAAP